MTYASEFGSMLLAAILREVAFGMVLTSMTIREPAMLLAARRSRPTQSVKMTTASASIKTERMCSSGKSGSRQVNAAPKLSTPSWAAYKLSVSRGRRIATIESGATVADSLIACPIARLID